jgi:hypothetical protein
MKFIKMMYLVFLIILSLNLAYSDLRVTFTEEDFTLNNVMVKDGYFQLAYTDLGLQNYLEKNDLKLEKISIEEKRTLNDSEWMRIENTYFKILNLNDTYIEKIYLGEVGLIDGIKKDNNYYVNFNIKVSKLLFNDSNNSGILNNIEIIDEKGNKFIAEYNYNFDSYSLDLPIYINQNKFYFPFDKYNANFQMNNAILNNYYSDEPSLTDKDYYLNLEVENNNINILLERNFLFQYIFMLIIGCVLAYHFKLSNKKVKNKEKTIVSFISVFIIGLFVIITKGFSFLISIGSILFLLLIFGIIFYRNRKVILKRMK